MERFALLYVFCINLMIGKIVHVTHPVNVSAHQLEDWNRWQCIVTHTNDPGFELKNIRVIKYFNGTVDRLITVYPKGMMQNTLIFSTSDNLDVSFGYQHLEGNDNITYVINIGLSSDDCHLKTHFSCDIESLWNGADTLPVVDFYPKCQGQLNKTEHSNETGQMKLINQVDVSVVQLEKWNRLEGIISYKKDMGIQFKRMKVTKYSKGTSQEIMDVQSKGKTLQNKYTVRIGANVDIRYGYRTGHGSDVSSYIFNLVLTPEDCQFQTIYLFHIEYRLKGADESETKPFAPKCKAPSVNEVQLTQREKMIVYVFVGIAVFLCSIPLLYRFRKHAWACLNACCQNVYKRCFLRLADTSTSVEDMVRPDDVALAVLSIDNPCYLNYTIPDMSFQPEGVTHVRSSVAQTKEICFVPDKLYDPPKSIFNLKGESALHEVILPERERTPHTVIRQEREHNLNTDIYPKSDHTQKTDIQTDKHSLPSDKHNHPEDQCKSRNPKNCGEPIYVTYDPKKSTKSEYVEMTAAMFQAQGFKSREMDKNPEHHYCNVKVNDSQEQCHCIPTTYFSQENPNDEADLDFGIPTPLSLDTVAEKVQNRMFKQHPKIPYNPRTTPSLPPPFPNCDFRPHLPISPPPPLAGCYPSPPSTPKRPAKNP